MRAAAAAPGLLMLVLPALSAPAPAQALTVAGALLVLGSIIGSLDRWPWIGTRAAASAVMQSVLWRPGSAILALDGLLILGYLILLDRPGNTDRSVRWQWLRLQIPFVVAGLLATSVILAALGAPLATSAWLALAALAGAVTAYLVALPR
jgi:hypothetical protein